MLQNKKKVLLDISIFILLDNTIIIKSRSSLSHSYLAHEL